MNGRIYIHKNKINGKCYVGQTIQNPKVRWGKNGINYKRQEKFYNAIKLYGWKNFENMVLPTIYKTQDELNKAEIEMIQDLDSINNGYNVSLGGHDITHNQEYIDSVSKQISQYDMDGNLITTFKSIREAQRETNIERSNIQKNVYGKVNSAGGFVWVKGNNQKIDKSKVKHGTSVRVYQYDLSDNFIKDYVSMHEASKITGVSYQNIYHNCKGNRKTAGGYKWSYR